jgi:hypothetical protein
MIKSFVKCLGCFVDNIERGFVLYHVPYKECTDLKYLIIKTLFLIVFAIPIFVFLLADSIVCFTIKFTGLVLSLVLTITIVGPFVVGFIFSIIYTITIKIFDLIFLFFRLPDILFSPVYFLQQMSDFAKRNYAYL